MRSWIRIALGALLAVVVLVAGVVFVGSRNLAGPLEVPPHSFDATGGDLIEGQRLATVYVCTTCHGGDLGGLDFLEAMPLANLPAPNLTGGRFTDDEIERAVRHGVGADGRPLAIMPSAAFADLANADLADIVAYVQSLPPVSSELQERHFGPVGLVVAALDPDALLTGRTIEHEAAHPPRAEGEDGRYLTAMCRFCHGQDLGGAVFVGEVELWARNLTPDDSGIGGWDLDRFRSAVQEGVSATGLEMDANHMPWRAYAAFTDAEMVAIWDYLSSLPPISRPPPEG